MSSSLKLDWCSHEAAKYAVEHWHYSGAMPAGKTVKVGVWEDGRFIGAVIFCWGANLNIGHPYGLQQTQVCELVRVALSVHLTPVSKVVSVALRMLHRQSPGVRLIISYADPDEGHHGGIYQAMNWLYVGTTPIDHRVWDGVRWLHRRTMHARYGHSPTAGQQVKEVFKHKYLMPLDAEMRAKILPLAKPYPKRTCVGSVASDTGADQALEGGATPTPTLQGI